MKIFLSKERIICLSGTRSDCSRAQYSWLLVSLFTRIVATSAFIPIVKVMFEAMSCQQEQGGRGAFVWSVDPTVQCWRDESFALGIGALAVLLFYVPLCARFFRVRRVACRYAG